MNIVVPLISTRYSPKRGTQIGAFVLKASTRRMALRVRSTKDPISPPLTMERKKTEISK